MASHGPSPFHTTQWSLIAALPHGRGDARSETQEARAHEALTHLCNAYWRPLYAFARHRGHAAEDARDLTQAFLAEVIETGGLGGAERDRGRFRSYLLGAMKHFMARARDHAKAQKRGGGHRFVPFDIADIESRIAAGGRATTPAETDLAFDRNWAQETTAAALDALEVEWSARGKAEHFAVLRGGLTGEGPAYAEAAARLGMTENTVAVMMHRLRRRYADLVREAVAQTVADAADIDDELRHLVRVLREK